MVLVPYCCTHRTAVTHGAHTCPSQVIATHLPETEIMGLKSLFEDMDSDRSGSISIDKLAEVGGKGHVYDGLSWVCLHAVQ